ncbi:MAG: nuclear transport factor 2 family protein [Planctomycetes bacterium]|nr:nuclear transport factor 2 family protein [Planctomycetota bacterium]
MHRRGSLEQPRDLGLLHVGLGRQHRAGVGDRRHRLAADQLLQLLDREFAHALRILHHQRVDLAGLEPGVERRRAVEADEALLAGEAELLERYVDAFHRYDVAALTALLREDASLSMPPYSLWLQGREAIAAWLLGRGCECRGSRLVPVAASGAPAFAQYRAGGQEPWALVVLELGEGGIAEWSAFLDTAALFPRFGLPPTLTVGAADARVG